MKIPKTTTVMIMTTNLILIIIAIFSIVDGFVNHDVVSCVLGVTLFIMCMYVVFKWIYRYHTQKHNHIYSKKSIDMFETNCLKAAHAGRQPRESFIKLMNVEYTACEPQLVQLDCRDIDCGFHKDGNCTNTNPAIIVWPGIKYIVCWTRDAE
jgi:hypothetical protein